MPTLDQMQEIEGLPVTRHPEIVSGAPVFKGTRVSVATLFEYLADDYSLDEFLECFPSVTRDAALKVLQFGHARIQQEFHL